MHSHEKNVNSESEVYIDLLGTILDDDLKSISSGNGNIIVAGSNSPTGVLSHSIPCSDKPQIILAIKKSQVRREWDCLNDFEKYWRSLGVTVKKIAGTNKIKITSNGETVIINTDSNVVTYEDGKGVNISETLDSLLEDRNAGR